MSSSKESTIEQGSLSSEQALDDYFTALLDESFETEEIWVDDEVVEQQPKEPEPDRKSVV